MYIYCGLSVFVGTDQIRAQTTEHVNNWALTKPPGYIFHKLFEFFWSVVISKEKSDWVLDLQGNCRSVF